MHTRLETIRVFDTQAEAAVARSLLDAHGIYALLPERHHAANAWHLTFALQGLRLSVLERDAAIAAELLQPAPGYAEPQTELTLSRFLLGAFCFLFGSVPYTVRRHKSDTF